MKMSLRLAPQSRLGNLCTQSALANSRCPVARHIGAWARCAPTRVPPTMAQALGQALALRMVLASSSGSESVCQERLTLSNGSKCSGKTCEV